MQFKLIFKEKICHFLNDYHLPIVSLYRPQTVLKTKRTTTERIGATGVTQRPAHVERPIWPSMYPYQNRESKNNKVLQSCSHATKSGMNRVDVFNLIKEIRMLSRFLTKIRNRRRLSTLKLIVIEMIRSPVNVVESIVNTS